MVIVFPPRSIRGEWMSLERQSGGSVSDPGLFKIRIQDLGIRLQSHRHLEGSLFFKAGYFWNKLPWKGCAMLCLKLVFYKYSTDFECRCFPLQVPSHPERRGTLISSQDPMWRTHYWFSNSPTTAFNMLKVYHRRLRSCFLTITAPWILHLEFSQRRNRRNMFVIPFLSVFSKGNATPKGRFFPLLATSCGHARSGHSFSFGHTSLTFSPSPRHKIAPGSYILS